MKPEKFWDLRANSFERNGGEKDSNGDRAKKIRMIKRFLYRYDTVLDFGCATGSLTFEIARDVKEIHGIDFSPKMIETAKRNAALKSLQNVTFTQTTIFDERLRKESFDAVVAKGILHLVKDPPKVIQRINELLKPEGFFISLSACMGEKRFSFQSMLTSLAVSLRVYPHFNFFTISELERLIIGGGFQIIETETYYTRGQAIHFVAARKK